MVKEQPGIKIIQFIKVIISNLIIIFIKYIEIFILSKIF